MSLKDDLLESTIARASELQSEMHKEGDSNAYNVFTMVALLKGMRRPEVIEQMDAERLQRARVGA